MKITLLLATLLATLGLCACNPASAPGASGATGTLGYDGAKGDTGRTGNTGDTIVVVPVQK